MLSFCSAISVPESVCTVVVRFPRVVGELSLGNCPPGGGGGPSSLGWGRTGGGGYFFPFFFAVFQVTEQSIFLPQKAYTRGATSSTSGAEEMQFYYVSFWYIK